MARQLPMERPNVGSELPSVLTQIMSEPEQDEIARMTVPY